MTQLFANNAATTTVGAVTNVATSITVALGSVFPVLAGGDFFLLTLILLDGNGNESAWEIVKVTARAGNVLTVTRAQEGTAAVAWAGGTRAELRVTAGVLNALLTTPSGGATADPTAATYTYTNGVVTGISETVAGLTRTTVITYNTDGSVNTNVVTYNGKTRTETYAYTNGDVTGMTAVEV